MRLRYAPRICSWALVLLQVAGVKGQGSKEDIGSSIPEESPATSVAQHLQGRAAYTSQRYSYNPPHGNTTFDAVRRSSSTSDFATAPAQTSGTSDVSAPYTTLAPAAGGGDSSKTVDTSDSPSAPPAAAGAVSTEGLNTPNDSCSGQTLNVPRASLNWWYNATVYDAVSTLSGEFGNATSRTGWKVLPAITPFDLNSALTNPSFCSSPPTSDVSSESCVPTPAPVAAKTTVITQVAYQDAATTGANGALPDVVSTPPSPPFLTVPGATGRFFQPTAFIYFSEYELVTRSHATSPSNGQRSCVTVTSAHTVDPPYSFAYEGTSVDGFEMARAGVTGDLASDLPSAVNASITVAGQWTAMPTVVILVQQVYAAILEPDTVPVLLTPSGFLGAARPIASSPSHDGTTGQSSKVPHRSRYAAESPALSASLGSSPAPVVRARYGEREVTESTPSSGTSSTSTTPSPTNAWQVLSEALATMTTSTSSPIATVTPTVTATSTLTATNTVTVTSTPTSTPSTSTSESTSTSTSESISTTGSTSKSKSKSTPTSTSTSTPSSITTVPSTARIIYIGSTAYAPNARTAYKILGQVLLPGGSITLPAAYSTYSTLLSLLSNGRKFVIDVDGNDATHNMTLATRKLPVPTIVAPPDAGAVTSATAKSSEQHSQRDVQPAPTSTPATARPTISKSDAAAISLERSVCWSSVVLVSTVMLIVWQH